MFSQSQEIKKRIGWYPITTTGVCVTIIYSILLIYVVFKINTDLYSTNISLFMGSVLIVAIIVIIMLWAKYTGETPFKKH